MELSVVFSSGMVFAKGKPVRIFGTGCGRAVISFAGISKSVVSDSDFWCVEFPPLEYGGPYELSFFESEKTLVLSDIYIGEVYLFSGQSNMAMTLGETNTANTLYEDNNALRYLAVSPASDKISWEYAKREEISAWSALGYLVSREIVADRNIRVGIILCASGATVIETWMPSGALSKIGINIPMEEKYPDHYKEMYAAKNIDGFLYSTKLSLIMPYSLSGVVWYQGESDASEAEGRVYARELCELIRIWRSDFRDERLPFCIVEIADCDSRIALGPGWRMIQEAQSKIPSLCKNTYEVISRDICETDAIHPPTKDKLAVRIADVIKKNFFN